MEQTEKTGWRNPPRQEPRPDRRDQAPSGMDPIEYGRYVAKMLPCSTLTRRETYGLKCYIESLESQIWALEDDLK